ncbi:hypothetical protein EGW08_023584 [Elysia chlorotica]|uniref:Uncharacterized protein n=1 Tax=Elysia chlorotica TaxID=188477 RepID=A0A3S1APZ5_ELYCH|nr:hypothetical protein EGW08_023584 [Elysia chlorotica]
MDKFYILPFDESLSSTVTVPPAAENIPVPTELENTPMATHLVKQSVQVLRGDCKTCISHKSNYGVMKMKTDTLLMEKRALKKEMTVERTRANIELKKRLEEKTKKIKSMTKQMERKKSIESRLRIKCNAFKSLNDSLLKKVSLLEDSLKIVREMKNMKIKLAHQERKAAATNKELDRLKKENKKLQGENKELKDANDYLLSVQEEWNGGVEDSDGKSKSIFDTKMRKATYHAVLAQCPVGNLIKTVVNDLPDKRVEKVPSKSSVARMTHELSVLSSIQTVDFLMNSSVVSLTLISWDATTELGHHINEIHIRSNLDVTHTISIERLPGGRAEDYCNHTERAINEMCSAYAEYSGMMYEVVRGQVLSKIISSLTHRAAVNHATSRLLNLHLGLELIELNCNLHVLDGIANRVRSALKALDGKTGLDGDNYCLASKVIYMVSKLRQLQVGIFKELPVFPPPSRVSGRPTHSSRPYRQIDYLLSVQEEWNGGAEESDGKSKSMFDTRMRKATYHAVLAQCPVGNLIKTVVNDLPDKRVEKVPSKSSVARMTHELSVIVNPNCGVFDEQLCGNNKLGCYH